MVKWRSPAEAGPEIRSVSRLSGIELPDSAQRKLDEIGRPAINLHRTLGHTPEMLGPLLDLIHAARYDALTSRQEREMMIVRIGQLEQSDYELAHHVPMALEAGLSEEQLDDMSQWRSSELFSQRAKAVLALADSLGEGHPLNDESVDEHLSAAEQTELAMVGSTYIMIARISRTFDIEIDDYLRT